MSVRDFQERKKVERILFSLPVLALLSLFVVFAAWGVVKAGYRKYLFGQEAAALRDKFAAAEGQRAEYEERLRELATPEGLDREARGKFNLKKPGEEVVLFLESPPLAPQEEESGIASAWRSLRGWISGWLR